MLDLGGRHSYIRAIGMQMKAADSMTSSQTIQIVVLAAIAIFLILRLRNVLGTRDGFEPSDQAEPAAPPRLRVVEAEPEADDIAEHVDAQSPAAGALRAMKEIEPAFAIGEFLSGARQAYEMILMAFERGDLAPVRAFLSEPVAAAFQSVIDGRKAKGQVVEAEYLGTRETALVSAEFDPATRDGEITIRFVGELTVATRDASGAVVDGDPRHPRKQRDTWTFGRQMGNPDPNWRLVATG